MFTWSKQNGKQPLDTLLDTLLQKGAAYCFSFVTPVRPHEPLPDRKPKTPRYTKRNSVAAEEDLEEEKVEAEEANYENDEGLPNDIFDNIEDGKSEDEREREPSPQPPSNAPSEPASPEQSPAELPKKRKREEEQKKKGGRKRTKKDLSPEEEVPLPRKAGVRKNDKASREAPQEVFFEDEEEEREMPEVEEEEEQAEFEEEEEAEEESLDEEQMFAAIGEMLEQLAREHGKTVDQVQAIYEKVNCDSDLVRGVLEGTVDADV